MKTTSAYTKFGLLLVAAVMFTAPKAFGDTYSWTNFQSDIAGVAQHVDPNLVNPWGMAASGNGIIWVSDNGTGVSTLYNQDGTARPLVVTIVVFWPGRAVPSPQSDTPAVHCEPTPMKNLIGNVRSSSRGTS